MIVEEEGEEEEEEEELEFEAAALRSTAFKINLQLWYHLIAVAFVTAFF